MNRRIVAVIISIILIAVVTGLLFITLAGLKKDPPRRPVADIIRSVKAVPVQYNKLTTKIKAGGRVNSKTDIVLSAEVSGKILPGNVPLKKGQSFKKGDLLIHIYHEEALLALKAKKSSFLNRIAGILPDFKITFPDSYNAWYKYFENIDIDFDLPELPKFNSTQEKVFLASRNLLTDFYTIKSDESRFKKHDIYAPFNGAFTEVTAEVGAIANPGSKLARIVNTINLELEVPLEISEAKWLRQGDKVTLTNGSSKTKWTGSINRVSKTVDEATQSISVFIDVNSSASKPIYKGQYLTAEFNGIELSNIMEIPRAAVFNTNEVFVVVDSLLTKRIITIAKTEEKSLFFNGIEEGLNLVVEPLINVSEKTKVKILSEN